MLGQRLGKSLSADAVVSVGVENPEHSSVDLQRGHTQGRPSQLIHQDMAVNTVQVNVRGKRKKNCIERIHFYVLMSQLSKKQVNSNNMQHVLGTQRSSFSAAAYLFPEGQSCPML